MKTIQDAINHVESLYPPDSQYEDTAQIGRELMNNSVGNSVGFENWRELPKRHLFLLCRANLLEHGEKALASEFLISSVDAAMGY